MQKKDKKKEDEGTKMKSMTMKKMMKKKRECERPLPKAVGPHYQLRRLTSQIQAKGQMTPWGGQTQNGGWWVRSIKTGKTLW